MEEAPSVGLDLPFTQGPVVFVERGAIAGAGDRHKGAASVEWAYHGRDPLTRGSLAYLLRTRFYIGEVRYRGDLSRPAYPDPRS